MTVIPCSKSDLWWSAYCAALGGAALTAVSLADVSKAAGAHADSALDDFEKRWPKLFEAMPE